MGNQKKGRGIMQPAHIFNRAPVKPEVDFAKSLYPKLEKIDTDDIPEAVIPDEITQPDGKKLRRKYTKSKPAPAPEVDDDNSPEGT